MPEKTKRNKDFEKPAEKRVADLPAESPENNTKDTWGADQQEKSYYYDDSYGYEVYNPDDDEDEGNDE
jgi:hypothetical protein